MWLKLTATDGITDADDECDFVVEGLGWGGVIVSCEEYQSTYLPTNICTISKFCIPSVVSIPSTRHHELLLNACLRIPYCLLRPNPEINNYNMHDAIKQKPLFCNHFASGHLCPSINPYPELFIGSNSLHVFVRILQ